MISATIDDIRFLRNGADGGHVYVRGRGSYEGHGVIDIYAHFQTKEMEREFEATYKAGPIVFYSIRWDFEPSIGLSLWEVVQWSPRMRPT